MNFTEIYELNDILSHSRSFRSHAAFTSQPKNLQESYSHDLNFISVDDLVTSSLKDFSPMKCSRNLNKLNFKEEDESIDKIMADINQSIFPIFLTRTDHKKRSKEQFKPLMLICSSASLKEITSTTSLPFPRKIQRAITLEIEESTFQEESPPKKNKTSIDEEELEKIEEKKDSLDEKNVREIIIAFCSQKVRIQGYKNKYSKKE